MAVSGPVIRMISTLYLTRYVPSQSLQSWHILTTILRFLHYWSLYLISDVPALVTPVLLACLPQSVSHFPHCGCFFSVCASRHERNSFVRFAQIWFVRFNSKTVGMAPERNARLPQNSSKRGTCPWYTEIEVWQHVASGFSVEFWLSHSMETGEVL